MTRNQAGKNHTNPFLPTDSILSIDADAHLEKLTTHTYRSPAHYPVELVRLALKRGASRISVLINRRKIEIRDNGRGIDTIRMEKLKTLMESEISPEEKEQVIIDLQETEGIGLLSLFSPSPSAVVIENTGQFHAQNLRFENRSLREFDTRKTGNHQGPVETGTRMVIYRKGSRADQEIDTLREYCRGVRADLELNGEKIGNKSVIRHVLVSLNLNPPESPLKGEMGIPMRGDVCHIWMLEQGIPVSRRVIAPWRGFLFDAALETSQELTGKMLDGLLGDINRLYHYLIEQFSRLPRGYQHRVEELVFKHHRLSGESKLVDYLPTFHLHDASEPLTLKQLRNLSRSTSLFAVPQEQDVSRYDVTGKTVLLLSQQQIDYLVNHSPVTLQFLNPVNHHSLGIRLWYGLLEKWQRLLSRLPAPGVKMVSISHLNQDERLFEDLLQKDMASRSTSPDNPFRVDEVHFIEGRGLLPWRINKHTRENGNPLYRCLLRRKHPLIKKAVRSAREDPENMDFLRWLFQ